MKTLAELELESTEGFSSPIITDSELREKIKAMQIKAASEIGGTMTVEDFANEELDED